MTLTVFCILLFAALLHASWNARVIALIVADDEARVRVRAEAV